MKSAERDAVRVCSCPELNTYIVAVLDEHDPSVWPEARAIACACRAYEHYLASIRSDRWRALLRHGARTQRLLWASTSSKDSSYSDVKYIEELIAADTVTTLPLETLAAFRDHGRAVARLETNRATAGEILQRLAAHGIDIENVAEQLEREGLRKFTEPFDRVQQWLDRQRRPAVLPAGAPLA